MNSTEVNYYKLQDGDHGDYYLKESEDGNLVKRADYDELRKEFLDHMWWERTAVDLQKQRDKMEQALRKIANSYPANVYSPIGLLHAAGMVTQWSMDAQIALEALG